MKYLSSLEQICNRNLKTKRSGEFIFLLESEIYFSSDDFIVKFCFTVFWEVNVYKSLKVLLGGGREFLSLSEVPEALPIFNSSNQ